MLDHKFKSANVKSEGYNYHGWITEEEPVVFVTKSEKKVRT